jgi:type VI protein secretion system component Hcp
VADNLPDVYIRFLEADGSPPRPLFAGDSMDMAYPGKEEGWFTINDFNFGFGWGGSDASAGVTKAVSKEKDAESRLRAQAEQIKALQSQVNTVQTGAKGGKAAAPKKEEGTLKPKEFSFSRNPSKASTILMKKCRNVEEIPKVELLACRAAGVDFTMGKGDSHKVAKDAKIPFLRLMFEKVYLIKCGMSVTTAPTPTESIDFVFQKVQMETVWTDNETGKRVTGGINRVWFDFGNKEKDAGGIKIGADQSDP